MSAGANQETLGTAPQPAASRRPLALLLLVAAVAALSLWLRSGFPIHAIGGASFDDALFIRLAGSLRRAHWLGSYDEMTLAKGMFYPLFIAATSLLHIPLKMAEHLVYLAAAAGFAWVACRLSGNRWLGGVLFSALALNPVLWTLGLARVVREGLYIGLCLGAVAAAGALCLVSHTTPVRRRLALGAGTGAVCAACWLTREEGVWLIPSLAAVAVFGALAIAADPVRAKSARAAGLAALAGLGTAITIVATVAGLNRAVYGVFTDVEFRAHGFLSAYGALTRVKQDEPQAFVPVPRAVREKVYAVSPAAAELRPWLEGDMGAGWQRTGCAQQSEVLSCLDIRGGWFVWALRSAAAAAGHSRSGREAEDFYDRMAREINTACTLGRLACLPPRVGLSPQLRAQHVRDAIAVSPRMASLLLTFGKGEVYSLPSEGTPAQMALFRGLAGPIAASDGNAVITDIDGWIAAPHGPPAIAVVDGAGNPSGLVNLTPAPDVDRIMAGRGLFARRFSIAPECPENGCTLVITTADGAVRQLPLSSLNREVPADPAYLLTVEFLGHRPGAAMPLFRTPAQRLARALTDIYALGMPVLFATGCLGLIIGLWAFRRAPALVLLGGIGVAAGAGVAARIALLSYLDVTSFPALNTPYLSPASPFAIVVAVLGIWLGARALLSARGRPRLSA